MHKQAVLQKSVVWLQARKIRLQIETLSQAALVGGKILVYKITIDTDCFDSVLVALKDLGDFVLKQNQVFLYTDKEIPDRDYFQEVIKLNSDNYKMYTNFSDTVKTWCLEKLSKDEVLAFEESDECQKKLKLLNKYIDELEKGLEAIRNGEKKTTTAK